MSELQSTIEFSVELFKFYNVDLFQRGIYQVRCSLRVSAKLGAEVEVATPEVTTGLGSAIVLGNYGACRPFKILYRNEEVSLKDVVLFRCHMLVDAHNLRESLDRADFALVLDLWFSDASLGSMALVSTRTLHLNFSPVDGLHYHLPVVFDYFHLSAVSVTIHAALTALVQPSSKRGILRYVQSCAPKTSKSWSKIRSSHCSTLTDPVPHVNRQKFYNRINESSQVHLEAYNVLLSSSNNLKTTIKEYKRLLMQREEVVSDNYDTLIVKYNDYDSTKLLKRNPYKPTSSLEDLCAGNIKLWNYFLLTFSCKMAIQQYLSKKHHYLRVRRFAELFFVIDNPRKSALDCYETKYQRYLGVSELARRSKYMQLLPPLPVHCGFLDGDSATMPIIFEDQYQDTVGYDCAKKELEPRPNTCAATLSRDLVAEQAPFRRSKTADMTVAIAKAQCSCGLFDVWEPQKPFMRTVDYYNDKTKRDGCFSNTVPHARHSKSLDQLLHEQQRQSNSFHRSMGNIGRKKAQETVRPGRYKKKEQVMVKSASHTIGSESETIPRSTSMQALSPKRLVALNGNAKKFNSLINQKKSASYQNGAQSKTKQQPEPKNQRRKSKLFEIGRGGGGGGGTDGGSTLSSTSTDESLPPNYRVKETGSSCKNNASVSDGLRKVRSASCLPEDMVPLLQSSGAESLPNLSPRTQARYRQIGSRRIGGLYYSSCSSSSSSSSSNSTSEQSGWISSRSSSIGSSTDVANQPPPPASASIDLKLDKIQRELTRLTEASKKIGDIGNRRRKSDIFNSKNVYLENNQTKNGEGKERKLDLPLLTDKGCEQNQTVSMDDIALPPPKQFRDLLSPSSSVTTTKDIEEGMDRANGALEEEEEEINAYDNMLYHVIGDFQTDVTKERPSQFESGKGNSRRAETENEDFNVHKGHTESLKAFLKAKKEFKSQLAFQGVLYSDLNSFASKVPYFHIADEFRIFSPEGMHLVICVHGLDGNAADLRLVKTYLEMGLPGAYLDFLMSERNQGDTFSDFDTMTDRLVSEILQYLDGSSIRPTRISFVGHSLGNIIIRSALTRPQLKFLLPRLHTFLSLSGPHLGTLYNSSGLVNMGMWFMQKWKKSGSLLQLSLKDAADPRQSFLYNLSQKSTLHHFKNILLCGSGQDRYVPLHSARIELCKESIKDSSEQGTVYRKMVHNIMQPIIAKKELKLVRYDIHHALPNTANALIGRAAHIAVLDSEIFIEKFMVVVGIKYFR